MTSPIKITYGTPPPPVLTAEQQANILANAVEKHLNDKAREYRYKDYHAAMAYAGSPVPKFSSHGVAFLGWVSAVWAHVDSVETAVMGGQRGVPTAVELLAELPAFVAPE